MVLNQQAALSTVQLLNGVNREVQLHQWAAASRSEKKSFAKQVEWNIELRSYSWMEENPLQASLPMWNHYRLKAEWHHWYGHSWNCRCSAWLGHRGSIPCFSWKTGGCKQRKSNYMINTYNMSLTIYKLNTIIYHHLDWHRKSTVNKLWQWCLRPLRSSHIQSK